jgi:hypothetical protein
MSIAGVRSAVLLPPPRQRRPDPNPPIADLKLFIEIVCEVEVSLIQKQWRSTAV